jgi:Bardet-Biedl syndrome 7 protein
VVHQPQVDLARKVGLLDALQEVAMQEPSPEFLAAPYRDALQNAAALRAAMKLRPRALETLYGIVTDLYVDRHKFDGHRVKHRIPQLMRLLDAYDFDSVVAFLNASP